jgi:hypothetical protein
MNKFFGLFFLFISLHLQAEIDSLFYAHLKESKLDLERYQLLKLELSGKHYLGVEQLKDYLMLCRNYNDSNALANVELKQYAQDTSIMVRAFFIGIHFRNEHFCEASLMLIKEHCIVRNYLVFQEFFDVMYRSKTKSIAHSEFQNIGEYIRKLERKKAWIAGLLSTVIPGLGKVYMLQSKTGFAEMFNLLVLGFVPIEILIKGAQITAGAVVGIALFVPFYLSNIYSAYHLKQSELKKCHQELRNEVVRYCDYQYMSL